VLVVFLIGLDSVRGSVGGVVVDDDDLVIGAGLGEE